MKRADIHAGVVYATGRDRVPRLHGITPVVVLDDHLWKQSVSAGQSVPRRERITDGTTGLRLGSTGHNITDDGNWERWTVGLPAVELLSVVSRSDPPAHLELPEDVSLAGFQEGHARDRRYRYYLLTAAREISGPWDEVVAEIRRRDEERDAHRAAEAAEYRARATRIREHAAWLAGLGVTVAQDRWAPVDLTLTAEQLDRLRAAFDRQGS